MSLRDQLLAAVADPAAAPLLPVSSISEAAAMAPEISSCLNEQPSRVRPLIVYFLRHPKAVAYRLCATALNLDGTVVKSVIEAVFAIPKQDFASIQDHLRPISEAVHRYGRSVGDAVPRPSVRSSALKHRLERVLYQAANEVSRQTPPVDHVAHLVFEGDADALERDIAEAHTRAEAIIAQAAARMAVIQRHAAAGGDPKSRRRKGGAKRLL